MNCININSSEYKQLLKDSGFKPEILKAKISLWQDVNGFDSFPTLKDLGINPSTVNVALKSLDILTSDKAEKLFKTLEKNKVADNIFWTKVQQDLAIPKEQVEILKSFDTKDRNQLITDLLSNYSYTVDINTAQKQIKSVSNPGEWSDNEIDNFFAEEFSTETGNTMYYSNLTVPGGTNYTEQEIATPDITPSIKGHAKFATDKGIGWFRSDDKQDSVLQWGVYTPENELLASFKTEQEAKEFNNKRKDKNWNQVAYVDTNVKETKTRRILEVQSDLFQKGRDKSMLVKVNKSSEIPTDRFTYGDKFSNFKTTFVKKDGKWYDESNQKYPLTEQVVVDGYNSFASESGNVLNQLSSNQFLQLLNKDNNWVTFFVKSIIQDTAKQTITEVQESDVEAKVKELENSGLLKIKCD